MHDVDAEHHARATPVGLVVHLTAAERREVPVVPEAEVELVSEHGRDGPLLRHPGEGMRERCEDVDLHEERSGSAKPRATKMRRRSRSTSRTHCETSGSAWPVSSSRTSFATPGGHVLHDAEPAALPPPPRRRRARRRSSRLLRRLKLIPRDSEDRAALDRAVESDDHPPPARFEATTAAALVPRHQARAHREALRVVARVLHDEGAVEAVRTAHAADRDQFGHVIR